MQALSVSRDLRDKYDRIIRDGNQQYREGRLLDSLVTYAQCWAIADTACTIAPPRQYADWSLKRQVAANTISVVRKALGAQKCCFEHCGSLATRNVGGQVFYPMCDKHAAEVKA